MAELLGCVVWSPWSREYMAKHREHGVGSKIIYGLCLKNSEYHHQLKAPIKINPNIPPVKAAGMAHVNVVFKFSSIIGTIAIKGIHSK